MSPAATTTLLQLTDPHLRELPGAGDRALADAVAMVRAASDVDVRAVLLTGDLSEDGSPASYRRLEAAIAPLRSSRTAVVAVPGNHDDGPTLRRALLEGAPVDRVVALDGVRLVCLDTTVPGAHHGLLGEGRLTWLEDVLGTPYPGGTVLVLHHPPLSFEDPVLDRLALRDADRLGDVVAGSDVRLIACGHAHQPTAGALAGVPVWCGPALAMQTDVLPPAGRSRSLVGHGGLSRITLAGAAATASFVPLAPDPQLRYDHARQERLAMLAELEAAGGRR